jgi:hypothetical protein
MKRTLFSLLSIALAAGSAACGDVVRQGQAPVMLVIDRLEGRPGNTTPEPFGNPLYSDVLTGVTAPAPCTPESPCYTVFADIGRATLRIIPKDITGAEPSSNNAVTLTRYRVKYIRADGRNVPGVDVPYGFDGAATGTVPPAGDLELPFELVRHVAKQESPLATLLTDSSTLTTLAEVTFFGRDQVGNEISVTGMIQVNFGNFGL